MVEQLPNGVAVAQCIPFGVFNAGIDQMFPSNYPVLFLIVVNNSDVSLY